MEKVTLKNGMIIYYYPLDRAYSTSIGLYINSGSSSEPKDKNGISHLLEHIHFRHLEDMSQKELYTMMDKIGAPLRAITYKEYMRFYLKVRPVFFCEAIEIFKKIITMYSWTKEDFKTEKKIVFNELVSKSDYVYTDQIMDSLIWGENPLSMPIIGTEETIDNLSLEDIIEYKKQVFFAGNIALVITGNITKETKKITKNLFEKIHIPTCGLNKKRMCCENPKRELSINLSPHNWEYVDIKLSFKSEHNPNLYELMVLNSILGGGTSSKLQGVLREKLTLTSDIYSYVEHFSEATNIRISLTTHKNNIYRCVREIVNVINNLKSEISDEDMDTNLTYFTENLWFWLEDPELLNSEIGCEVFNNVPLSIEDKIAEYKSITKSSLMHLSKNLFTPDNATLLIAGTVKHISKNKISSIMSCLGTTGEVRLSNN